MSRPTPFERGRSRLIGWKSFGSVGSPPERDLYTSEIHGVSAYLAPFTTARMGAVVFLHEAVDEGESAHLADLKPSRRAILGQVAHAVGGKLLAATREDEPRFDSDPEMGVQRVLERVDGFQIPEQGHITLSVGYRGEQAHERPTEGALNAAWRILAIKGDEKQALDNRLNVLSALGNVLDSPLDQSSLAMMEIIGQLVTPGEAQF